MIIPILTLIATLSTEPTNPYRGWNENFILYKDGGVIGHMRDGEGSWPVFSTLHIPITKSQFLFDGRHGICLRLWNDADPATHTVTWVCDSIKENGRGLTPHAEKT